MAKIFNNVLKVSVLLLRTQALYQTFHTALSYDDCISKKPVQVSRVLKIGDLSDSLFFKSM